MGKPGKPIVAVDRVGELVNKLGKQWEAGGGGGQSWGAGG